MLVPHKQQQQQLIRGTEGKLSSQVLLLTGHTSPVLSLKFSPDGLLASAANEILIWDTKQNIASLKPHKNQIIQVLFPGDVISASADKSVCISDINAPDTVKRRWKLDSFVNSIAAHQELVAGVSDDGKLRLWDQRAKEPVKIIERQWPLTAVALSAEDVFIGGIDNDVHQFDLKTDKLLRSYMGHSDTISGLALNSDATRLVSNSFDNSLIVWDIKPFSQAETRLVWSLVGAPHAIDKSLIRPAFSTRGAREIVACGSGDRTVVVWEEDKILYKLPGHRGTVTSVDFYGDIIASGGLDNLLYLGELKL